MRGGVFYCRSSKCKGKTSAPQKLSIVNCPLSIVHCQFTLGSFLQAEIFQGLLQHFLVHRRVIDDQTFVAFRGGGLVEAAEQVDF